MARGRSLLTVALCLFSLAFVVASQDPQTPPRFRAGVDIFEFEVSVLDSNRQPVRGLKAADFAVLENGRSQPIVGFSEVQFPEYDGPLTEAIEDVAPDVAANRYADRRLFAIVMDDWGMPERPTDNLAIVNEAKAIGKFIVDRMTSSDFMAVVLTRDTRYFPDFTNDHWKLFGNINEFRPPAGAERAYLAWITRGHIGGLVALADVARSLAKLPQHRKAIVYVSIGQAPRPGTLAWDQMLDAMKIAREAGIPIYPIDPSGLTVGGSSRIEGLRTLADNTGGVATVNTNDLRPGALRTFHETQSYYLIAYQQTGPSDRQFRKIDVRLKRPGLTAYTRSGRYPPGASDIVKPPPLPVDEAVDEAVEGLSRTTNRRLATYAVARAGGFEVVGEIGREEAASGPWTRGADVEARVTRGAGELVTEGHGRIAEGDRSVLLNIATSPAARDVGASSAGPFHVSVKVSSNGSSIEDGSDARLEHTVIGPPLVYRSSTVRAPKKPVAEFLFSRTERMRIEFPAFKPLTEKHVRLLRRTGEALPGASELVEELVDGRAVVSADVSLSFLAPADYVIEVFVRSGDDADRQVIAFRVK